MPINMLMPALSASMTEATLGRWTVREGDTVSAGDVVAEVESDKAVLELESEHDGVIGKILIPEGAENVPVGRVIAIVLTEGEGPAALEEALAGAETAPARETAIAGPPPQAEAGPAPPPSRSKPASTNAAANTPGAQESADKDERRIFASPLARRLAAQHGLELAEISGSGPHHRIVKADVEKALDASSQASVVAFPDGPSAPAMHPDRRSGEASETPCHKEPIGKVRGIIATRLSEAKQTVPHFYLTIDCELDALQRMRSELNARLENARISVNDFVVRAVALALMRVPAANVSYAEDAIVFYERADIAVAVATDTGLLTPIVRQAEAKGLAQISREVRALSARARAGRLSPEAYQGGTFSVSNLGMHGVREFAAIINPPQACILAVGAAEQRPVVRDNALAVATMMSCTLSVDHRALDGAVAAEFLSAFKALIEDPLSMLL